MRLLLTTFALLSLTISSLSYAESNTDDLTALLNEFMAGASANDEAAHDRFWAEELVYTSSAGERFGKAEIMSGFDDPAETAEDEPATVYTAEDIYIQEYGETAVVTFRLVGATQEQPRVVTQYYNTGTFLKRDGEWRAVAWQATKIPPAE
jgi:hypothetical protein